MYKNSIRLFNQIIRTFERAAQGLSCQNVDDMYIACDYSQFHYYEALDRPIHILVPHFSTCFAMSLLSLIILFLNEETVYCSRRLSTFVLNPILVRAPTKTLFIYLLPNTTA